MMLEVGTWHKSRSGAVYKVRMGRERHEGLNQVLALLAPVVVVRGRYDAVHQTYKAQNIRFTVQF